MGNLKCLKAFEKYLLSNNKSKETIHSYIRTIKQFLDLVNKLPEQICKEDIEKYKYWAHEIKHYDRNSLTPKYCAIKSFLEFLEIPDKELKSYKLSQPKNQQKPKTMISENIEQILAKQLADGLITPELYLEAVSKLKSRQENVSISIYG